MTIRERLRSAIRPTFLRAAQQLLFRSDLARAGWIVSNRSGLAVDASRKPLPWYTYPAIRFLESRLPKGLDILEYGCGHSTLWWMERSRSVLSVETDGGWAARVRHRLAPNAEVVVAPEPEVPAAAGKTGRRFDVIVIDGAMRNECAAHALELITQHGIVIWDNSDREEYRTGFRTLLDQGFHKVDFIGMGPINTYEWSTSIFYKPGNFLDL